MEVFFAQYKKYFVMIYGNRIELLRNTVLLTGKKLKYTINNLFLFLFLVEISKVIVYNSL